MNNTLKSFVFGALMGLGFFAIAKMNSLIQSDTVVVEAKKEFEVRKTISVVESKQEQEYALRREIAEARINLRKAIQKYKHEYMPRLEVGQIWQDCKSDGNPFAPNQCRLFKVTDIKEGFVLYHFTELNEFEFVYEMSNEIENFQKFSATMLVTSDMLEKLVNKDK